MKLFTLAAALLISLGLSACDRPVSKPGSTSTSEKPNMAPTTPAPTTPAPTPPPSDSAKDMPKPADPATPPPARP